MSTIRMLKDKPGKKAGSIHSVPFVQGREMVQAKEAEYVDAAAPPAPATPAELKKRQEDRQRAIDLEQARAALKRAHDERVQLEADHRSEIEALAAERDGLAEKVATLEKQIKEGGKPPAKDK